MDTFPFDAERTVALSDGRRLYVSCLEDLNCWAVIHAEDEEPSPGDAVITPHGGAPIVVTRDRPSGETQIEHGDEVYRVDASGRLVSEPSSWSCERW